MIDTKILEKIPVLAGLSTPELAALSKIITVKKYKKGEVLFERGDVRKSFFIVLSGQVHVYRMFNDEVQTLAILGKNNFAVESALTNPRLKHDHSSEVTEAGDMIEILGKDFLRLADDYPQIANKVYGNIIANLAERLHHANNKLVTIYSTGKIASTYTDLDNLTELITTTILKIIKANRALFAFYRPKEGTVSIIQARGYPSDQRIKNLKIDLFKDPLLGLMYKTRREIIVTREMYRKKAALRVAYSSPGMMGVPLQIGDRVVGAILLGDKVDMQDFNYNNQILLNIIARQIVLPIAMAESAETV
ncbi:MAG: cyclic nucleotide-binding domain-containing protein [Patescibacteria group bacterium]